VHSALSYDLPKKIVSDFLAARVLIRSRQRPESLALPSKDFMETKKYSRNQFLSLSAAASGALLLPMFLPAEGAAIGAARTSVPLYAHLWVYASRFPPDWDCTPIMEDVFSDLKYAGMQGVEIMEVHLRQQGAVERFKNLVQKYSLPVTGASYYADMWKKEEHAKILDDLELVTERLQAVGGGMLGITVGDAKRRKTEAELDAQALLLQKAVTICTKNRIEPNLHNHTFEVANQLHDLKGTLARVPELKLGPDLNWLVRGGVDPVWFIQTFGKKMVYMHLRDQDAAGKWTEAVGEGVMDFTAIARALKQMDYKGKAAIELAFDKPPMNPVREDWKKSRQYVKKIFGW
jgi:sugar phosphate isomerase/epimerase